MRTPLILAIRNATLFLAIPLLAGSVALGDANGLVRNSPFVPEGFKPPQDRRDRTPAPPPQTRNQPQPLDQMEFRGMTQVGGERSFSLFDATEKKSFWIGANQTEGGFTIVEFKEKEDAVVVRHEGKTRTIALHEAKVQNLQGEGVSDTTQRRGNRGQPAAEPEDPESRMQNLAEEIRRRREVRRALIERSENNQTEEGNTPPPQDTPELP